MKGLSITEALLFLYVALMPFSPFGPEKFGVNLSMCDFVFPFMALAFLIEKRHSLIETLQEGRVFLLFLVFIFMSAISMLHAVNIGKSLLELTGYAYLFALAITIVGTIDNMERLFRLIKIWLLISLAVVIMGMAGFALFFMAKSGARIPFIYYTDVEKTFTVFPRLQATFYTPNMMLTYLHASIVFAIAYLFMDIRQKGLFVLIILMFIEAFFTASRRFAGLLFTVFLILRRFSTSIIITWLKRAVLILFIAFSILSLVTTIWQFFPVRLLATKPGISINSKLSMHLFPQVVSLRMFAKHPLIGIGVGNYNLVFRNFYPPEKEIPKYDLDIRGLADGVREKRYAQDPHSLYLGVLAETGLAGFAALMLFFIGLYTFIFNSMKYAREAVDKNIIYIFACGVAGFLFNGLTIDILTMRHLWFLVALTVAFISICRKEVV